MTSFYSCLLYGTLYSQVILVLHRLYQLQDIPIMDIPSWNTDIIFQMYIYLVRQGIWKIPHKVESRYINFNLLKYFSGIICTVCVLCIMCNVCVLCIACARRILCIDVLHESFVYTVYVISHVTCKHVSMLLHVL